jgi:hypothetical protein
MAFAEDWRKMLDYYFETEKQFIELSRIIPLDNLSETYSPNLFGILQMSCSQIINIMRLLCDKLELRYNDDNFPSFYEQLNVHEVLEKQQVALLKAQGGVIPFRKNGDEPPIWWTAYNKTKHNLPQGFKSGNIGNTTNALAGLYSLHCMCYYAELVPKNDFLDDKKWCVLDSLPVTINKDVHRQSTDYRPRSEAFYCLSYFKGEGADIGI